MLRHFFEIRVGQVGHQVVHRRIATRAVAKADQLVVQVAGRFAGNAGKVAIGRALALLAVAGDAALHPGLDGIELAEGRDGFVRLFRLATGSGHAEQQQGAGQGFCDVRHWLTPKQKHARQRRSTARYHAINIAELIIQPSLAPFDVRTVERWKIFQFLYTGQILTLPAIAVGGKKMALPELPAARNCK